MSPGKNLGRKKRERFSRIDKNNSLRHCIIQNIWRFKKTPKFLKTSPPSNFSWFWQKNYQIPPCNKIFKGGGDSPLVIQLCPPPRENSKYYKPSMPCSMWESEIFFWKNRVYRIFDEYLQGNSEKTIDFKNDQKTLENLYSGLIFCCFALLKRYKLNLERIQ